MKLRYLLAVMLSAILLSGFAGSAYARANAKKKILVVTCTTGFHHDSIPTAEAVLKDIGEKTGIYTVDYCRTVDDVKKMLTPEYLNANHFDAVFFANTTGNLGIPDLHAFLDWIKAGHGFLGAHSATDTYHPRDTGGDNSYVDMIGAEFMGHGAQCEVDCIVNDPKFPAVSFLGPDWKIFDEIYLFTQDNRDKVHVLLSLDKYPHNGQPNQDKPGDYLISWCKMYGKGRVFYTALVHRIEVWKSDDYQKHLLGAIKWVLGLAKGSAKPGPLIAPHLSSGDAAK
jgi:type 1 glutamine amidotransferase